MYFYVPELKNISLPWSFAPNHHMSRDISTERVNQCQAIFTPDIKGKNSRGRTLGCQSNGLSLLGLLAKIKCSICSYQLNIWYAPKGAQILNWFLEMVRGSEACFTPGTGCPGIAVPPWMAHPLLVINWNLSRILQSLIFLQASSTAQDFLKSSRFVSYAFSWVVFNLKIIV